MPYFPPIQAQPNPPYWCPSCQTWYRTKVGMENMTCCVLHPAGSCCHAFEEVVEIPGTTSAGAWQSYSQCQSCGHWFTGTHTCYGQCVTTTGTTISINTVGLTPYEIYDHVRDEAAKRYKPQGIHVPPLS